MSFVSARIASQDQVSAQGYGVVVSHVAAGLGSLREIFSNGNADKFFLGFAYEAHHLAAFSRPEMHGFHAIAERSVYGRKSLKRARDYTDSPQHGVLSDRIRSPIPGRIE